jgi:lipopolysaccharide export system permease protein
MKFPSKIDRYLIRQFLLTFCVAISLIIGITIVFDISERLDAFIGKYGVAPTFKEIVFDYYLNFIPFFVNLFSPLFVFISVIYFTSRLAYRMEIISIITAGWSYRRLMLPYLVSALLIGSVSYGLSNYIIPRANAKRIAFERQYFRRASTFSMNVHQRIGKNEYVYAERYGQTNEEVYGFAYEVIEGGVLRYKILAKTAYYNREDNTWSLHDYLARNPESPPSTWRRGAQLDTVLPLKPELLAMDLRQIEIMTQTQLNAFIEAERSRGSTQLPYYLVEKHSRNAAPLAAIILTLIAVPVSSRKLRGGIGVQLAFGVALAFSYIMIQKITVSFALNGALDPFLGIWIPNLIFAMIGGFLAKFAQQ